MVSSGRPMINARDESNTRWLFLFVPTDMHERFACSSLHEGKTLPGNSCFGSPVVIT